MLAGCGLDGPHGAFLVSGLCQRAEALGLFVVRLGSTDLFDEVDHVRRMALQVEDNAFLRRVEVDPNTPFAESFLGHGVTGISRRR